MRAPPSDGAVKGVVAANFGVGPAPPLVVGLEQRHALLVQYEVYDHGRSAGHRRSRASVKIIDCLCAVLSFSFIKIQFKDFITFLNEKLKNVLYDFQLKNIIDRYALS